MHARPLPHMLSEYICDIAVYFGGGRIGTSPFLLARTRGSPEEEGQALLLAIAMTSLRSLASSMTMRGRFWAGASLQELPSTGQVGDVTGYKLHGKHLDVDQSGVNKTFAVDMVWTCMPWHLNSCPWNRDLHRVFQSCLVARRSQQYCAAIRAHGPYVWLKTLTMSMVARVVLPCSLLVRCSVLAWAVCPIQTPWQRS